MRVLDLFSGCGGLSYGLSQAGLNIVAGVDDWEDALLTFKHNHPNSVVVTMDLSNCDPSKIEKTAGGHFDIIVGGPPCQGFSISGKRDPNDSRNGLYLGFVRAVEHFRPKIFLMENVPNLLSMDGGRFKDEIVKDFEKLGYEIKLEILTASDYGVPQNRRRVIMVGMLGKNTFSFPPPALFSSKITTAEAIGDLPEMSVDDGSQNKRRASNAYQRMMRALTNEIYNHETTDHNAKTVETIALVPDGGNYKNLPRNLQSTRKVNIAWTRYSSNKPSHTIDTGHRHHFHYKYNRVPTVRESARLQSFPDHFIFFGSKTSQYRQVGNAVPPIMAEKIGKELVRAFETSIYQIPDDFYLRIHHSRPRFKNDLENVLLYMASEIAKLREEDRDLFAQKLNAAIKLYPGNASKTEKTINNWRTEIASLLGLVEFQGQKAKPGQMAKFLASKQDLIEFFRHFLFKFQYPGGHLKPRESALLINAKVRFKPAKYLIRVMLEGVQASDNGKFGLSKAEATHCIFNDLRVTRENRTPEETLQIILKNRKDGFGYDNSGDTIRYAGDILDYMRLADLVRYRPNGVFYLNTSQISVLDAFIKNDEYFQPYKKLYSKRGVTASDISKTQDSWFQYVNSKLDTSAFDADALTILEEIAEEKEDKAEFITEMIKRIRVLSSQGRKVRTRDIGHVGEAIVVQHEKTRLARMDREELVKNVRKIPDHLASGFDILSFEGAGELKRTIEVKTTISKGKLNTDRFHMTPSEWGAAQTFGDAYYVYRLMVSSKDIVLFIIKNPVRQYRDAKIEMSLRDGADITYSEEAGAYEAVLA
ncbi:MAG: DNA (cytosine-5-)-methyltransferase [Chloroflexi bacterium]|nr:DNA (cytosine-5-)-methyltransferase [Chloroflexota bacterium]